MFIWFGENKANYEKGQVFPFVIAIIVVVVIMAMVTANLGKLSIFKTDVSNASDAASLTSVSGLSSFLMGLGLESDALCGNAMVRVIRMVEIFVLGRDDFKVPGFSLSDLMGSDDSSDDGGGSYIPFPSDLIAAVMLYITFMIAFIFSYIKAQANTVITWSSVKQSALAVAFGNSGVDERTAPEKKFKNYSGSYDNYLNRYMAREANETGFTRFMQHPISGFGKPIGRITSTSAPSRRVNTSGFGWSQNEDESFENSFDNKDSYLGYDNYVEVRVEGASRYPIEPLNFAQMYPGQAAVLTGIVGVGAFAKYWRNGLCACPVYCWIICIIEAAIDAAVFYLIVANMPVGYTFPGRDMKKYTNDNPIKLRVRRHKDNNNLSMWNFQYGDITAKSWGHAFVQGGSTIEPVFNGWNIFDLDTRKHLFETEIVAGSVE